MNLADIFDFWKLYDHRCSHWSSSIRGVDSVLLNVKRRKEANSDSAPRLPTTENGDERETDYITDANDYYGEQAGVKARKV